MSPRLFPGLVLLALLAAGCGSGTTGPVPDELAGRWEAAPFCWEAAVPPPCWFLIHSLSQPPDTVDLTDRLSADLRLDIGESGSFRFRFTANGSSVFDQAGDLAVEPGILVLTSTEGVDTLDYVLESGYLRLTFREHLSFDFDGDGTDEEAAASARLQEIR